MICTYLISCEALQDAKRRRKIAASVIFFLRHLRYRNGYDIRYRVGAVTARLSAIPIVADWSAIQDANECARHAPTCYDDDAV